MRLLTPCGHCGICAGPAVGALVAPLGLSALVTSLLKALCHHLSRGVLPTIPGSEESQDSHSHFTNEWQRPGIQSQIQH